MMIPEERGIKLVKFCSNQGNKGKPEVATIALFFYPY
jgi:hypothetical protein